MSIQRTLTVPRSAFPLLSTGTALLALVGVLLPFRPSADALTASSWLARLQFLAPGLALAALVAAAALVGAAALAATRFRRTQALFRLMLAGAAGAMAGVMLVIARPDLLAQHSLLVALAGH